MMNKNIILMVVTAVALVMLSAVAQAALEIISFTCNNMAPTANVESGDSMNCEASIQNTDSQNAAGVTSVTLYTTGGWSDAESYAGSDFLNSISAGGSTTAVFSNVIANTPGDNHKFLHIDIDGTAHTEAVTDLTVNSMTFKTLTVTPSVSSASSGTQFTVNAYLTAGGSITTASMTISLSGGGCALGTGETASKSLGSMSDNVEVSRSWTVTQGTSTCSITVDASGTSNPVTVTKSKTASVSQPGGSTDTTTSGAAGGGGGGGGGGGAKKTHELGTIDAAGSEVEVSKSDIVKFTLNGMEHTATVLDLTISSVKLEVKSSAVNITLLVAETKKIDLDEDGTTFDLSITLDSINITASTAKLIFKSLTEQIPLEPGVIPAGGICVPNSKKCAGNDLQTCRSDGLDWKITACEYGCNSVELKCKDKPTAPGPTEPTGQLGGGPPIQIQGLLVPLIVLLIIILAAGGFVYKRGGSKAAAKKRRFVLAITAILAAFVLIFIFTSITQTGYVIVDYENIVDCLTGKDVILYCAYWAGECREQTTLLGDFFDQFNYVDCDKDFDTCMNRGIREIPAWKIDGEIHIGKFSLEELGALAGC